MPECYISKGMLIYKYNPYYYQKLFDEIEVEINEMYHQSVSKFFVTDTHELIFASRSVDDLAVDIAERKERLERLKKKATRHCIHLQKALTKVPGKYRISLMEAQKSMNYRLMSSIVSESIAKELWDVVSKDEAQRLEVV